MSVIWTLSAPFFSTFLTLHEKLMADMLQATVSVSARVNDGE